MTGIRLLIVDDHPVVRTGLRGMFETDPGFVVVDEAANGAQAIEQVQATRPDLVLMDLQMPVLDGVAATARIRQLPNPPPVLVLTTYDSDNQILRAIEAGAAGYLLKDTPRETLFAAVRSAVGLPGTEQLRHVAEVVPSGGRLLRVVRGEPARLHREQ